MKIEKELYMPQHIPQGTPEDPDNPDFRKFTQEEKNRCWCPNCKYPYEYWNEMKDDELKRAFSSAEYSKAESSQCIDMGFTEREKYIYHLATLMAMEATQESIGGVNALNVKHLINLIKNNRCRKLKGKDIEKILKDMEEEVLLSQAVYNMDKEDNRNNARRQFQKRFFEIDF